MSNKGFHKQFNDIKKNVSYISGQMAKMIADQACDDLSNVHKEIINKFYEYNPNHYHRRHGLYNSLIPQRVVRVDKGVYQAGIVVSSFGMDDHYSGDITPDNVFDLMWNKGVRGLPKVGSEVLDHNYYFNGTFYDYGDNPRKWENPFWDESLYKNVFKVSLNINGHNTINSVPHRVMEDVTKNWGQFYGEEACDKAYKKFKDK